MSQAYLQYSLASSSSNVPVVRPACFFARESAFATLISHGLNFFLSVADVRVIGSGVQVVFAGARRSVLASLARFLQN